MSSIDERIVELQFNNKQFEAGVDQSVSSLERLKNGLNIEASAKSLDGLARAGRSFSLAGVVGNVQAVADRFSVLGIIGDQVLRRLTDSAINLGRSLITAIPNQIISGGKRRAQNLEQAQFQLEGLGIAWEKVSDSISEAVQDTAYGLDAAAVAASQYAASGVQLGEDMTKSLRAISGVAAMTNSSYEDTARVFTTIAGNGRVMGDQLNQLASRGLNVAAALAKAMNKSETEIRDMVSKGKIDFKTFATIMDDTFGAHAKEADKTFSGALSNMKASLSRMGAQFATPAYEELRKVIVALTPVLKDIEKIIKPLSEGFTKFAQSASEATSSFLGTIHETLQEHLKLRDAQKGVEKAVNGVKNAYVDKVKKGAAIFGFELTENQILDEKVAKYNKAVTAVGQFNSAFGKGADGLKKNLAVQINANKSVSGTEAIYKSATKMAETFKNSVIDRGRAFGESIGLLDKEKKALDENAKTYESLETIAKDVILGKYGNGEARKKALEDLGLSYAIVQNKVNELLGVEKRHKVTAEDEAKMAKFLSKGQEENAKEVEKTKNRFENFTSVLAGVIATLNLIKSAATALVDKIIRPFLSWGIPIVLDAILTVLGGIGKRLVSLNQDLTKKDFFNVKFEAIANGFRSIKDRVVDFVKGASHLGGIQRLGQALIRLKDALKELWKSALSRVTEGFGQLGDSMEFPTMHTFLKLLDTVTNKLADFINYMLDNGGSIAGFFKPLETLGGTGGGILKSLADGFTYIFSSIKNLASGKGPEILTELVSFIGTIAGALGKGVIKSLFNLGDGLGEAFDGIGLRDIFGLISAGGIAKIVKDLGVFSGALSKNGNAILKQGWSGLADSFSSVFGTVKSSLTEFQDKVKAEKLRTIAIAVGILTAAIVVLAALDPEKAAMGIGLVSAMLYELVAAMKVLSDISTSTQLDKEGIKLSTSFTSIGAAMIEMAVAVLILAMAMKKLSGIGWEGLAKGVISIGVMLFMLTKVMKEMAKLDSGKQSMVKIGLSMILLAIAVNKLSDSMVALSALGWEELARGLTGVVGALLAITMAMSMMPEKGMISAGIGIVLVAAALKLMTGTIKELSGLGWEELGRGIAGIAGALLSISFAMSLMPDKGAMKSAAAILVISVALKLIAGVIKSISEVGWEGLAMGVTAIAAALIIMVGALELMNTKGVLKSAASILIISIAMNALVPVLKALGSMSLTQVITSLAALGGAFVVLWLGAMLLQPVALTLVAVGGALALFGVAILAAGIGIGALVSALVLLAQSGSLLVTGFTDALGALLIAIIDNFTLIEQAVSALITALIVAVEDVSAQLVESGIHLILVLLQEIEANIGQFTDLAVQIVVEFCYALAANDDILVQAAIELIVSLVNALADAIRNNTGPILDAVGNLLSAVLEFILAALAEIVSYIPFIGDSLAEGINNARQWVRENLGGSEGLSDGGKYIEGLTDALRIPDEKKEEFQGDLRDLANTSGDNYYKTLGGLVTKYSDVFGLDDETAAKISGDIASLADYSGQEFNDHLQSVETDFMTALGLGESEQAEILKMFTTLGEDGKTYFKNGITDGDREYLKSLGVTSDEITELELFYESLGGKLGTSLTGSFNEVLTNYEAPPLFQVEDAAGNIGAGAGAASMLEKAFQVNNGDMDKVVKNIKQKLKFDNQDGSVAKDLVDSIVGTNYTQDELMEKIFPSGEFDEEAFRSMFEGIGENTAGGLELGILNGTDGAVGAGESVMTETLAGIAGVAEINSPSKVTKGYGEYLDVGLAQGITGKASIVRTAATLMATMAILAISKKLQAFKAAGTTAALAFIGGISSKGKSAKTAGTILSADASSGLKEHADDAYRLGQDFGEGFVRGIKSKASAAKAAAKNMTSGAVEDAATGQDSASPSKKTKKLGQYFGEGYIIGITSMGRKVSAVAKDMSSEAVSALRSPMEAIRNVLNSDLDVDPVIRPVLDLSDIQNGARTINGLLPAGSMSLGYISNSMNAMAARDSDADLISAIEGLGKNMNTKGGDTYVIDGITYDDGSNVSDAVRSLVRAARMERRR